jgi:hypothetical protein
MHTFKAPLNTDFFFQKEYSGLPGETQESLLAYASDN